MKSNFFCISLLALIGLILSACVTINIYFPAAAAEKAADRIIEEVWQLEGTEAVRETDKVVP
ncbi:hypothetical protein SAMN05216419_100257 [Nitrosomonas cryotolerans]|uniref:Uncharacterized protein n=1 Tax=Nitrosomonas cryotolerans ATCC 49181 TaxID=1131553 RepID=A0A1N6GSV3_9PROT|nr:hypothetical protein [Nitrosomonas cryotolerans]SFP40532.1 hypothetical protein SAMN05216419_100257 [Nitrosomonas cryotolerans]SIO10578.1 hypothetical protein SAMN02743940_0848 [Nitrosomonas cryotolerans ATCC 49181]